MPKPKNPGYQALKTELDGILLELQRDDLDVEAALKHYQRGLEVIQQIEHYLKTAENTLSELRTKSAAKPK